MTVVIIKNKNLCIYLFDLLLGVVILNNSKTRFNKNLKPLPYCLNVIIYSPLHAAQTARLKSFRDKRHG